MIGVMTKAPETPAIDVEHVLSNLRAELARRNLTQKDLAQYLDLSNATISDIMSGRAGLTVQRLILIARFLELEPASLLEVAA